MSLPHSGHFSERLGCRDWLDFRDLQLGGVIGARFGGCASSLEPAPSAMALRALCSFVGFV